MVLRSKTKNRLNITPQHEPSETHGNTVMSLWAMWSFFFSYPLYQYCGSDFLVGNMHGISEYLTWVDMWKFLAMPMPLPLTDTSAQPYPRWWWTDWISNIQKLPLSFSSSKCNKFEVCRQFQVTAFITENKRSKTSYKISPVVYVIWKRLKFWAGILPWHMAHGWEEARFLKRTFISFIAKLLGLWVSKYAAHSSRFSSNK